jgi:hypothetical protein
MPRLPRRQLSNLTSQIHRSADGTLAIGDASAGSMKPGSGGFDAARRRLDAEPGLKRGKKASFRGIARVSESETGRTAQGLR